MADIKTFRNYAYLSTFDSCGLRLHAHLLEAGVNLRVIQWHMAMPN